jgi:uncharacterized protein YndB with AHSA1/START domain
MGDVTVRLVRTFAAPRDEVFAAWTDPAMLAAWFWPWTPDVTIDPRPGGAYRLACVHPQAGAMAAVGVYREVVSPERLVFTWRWEGEVPVAESVVTLEFHDRGGETEVRLTQAPLADATDRDNHARGWNDLLDRLAEYVRGAGAARR